MRRQRERQWRKTPCAPGTVTATLLLSGSEFAGLYLHLAYDAPLVCSVSSRRAYRFLVYLSVPYTVIPILVLRCCICLLALCVIRIRFHMWIFFFISNSCWMSFRWSSLGITLFLFIIFLIWSHFLHVQKHISFFNAFDQLWWSMLQRKQGQSTKGDWNTDFPKPRFAALFVCPHLLTV